MVAQIGRSSGAGASRAARSPPGRRPSSVAGRVERRCRPSSMVALGAPATSQAGRAYRAPAMENEQRLASPSAASFSTVLEVRLSPLRAVLATPSHLLGAAPRSSSPRACSPPLPARPRRRTARRRLSPLAGRDYPAFIYVHTAASSSRRAAPRRTSSTRSSSESEASRRRVLAHPAPAPSRSAPRVNCRRSLRSSDGGIAASARGGGCATAELLARSVLDRPWRSSGARRRRASALVRLRQRPRPDRRVDPRRRRSSSARR